jgi:hypothetical protein
MEIRRAEATDEVELGAGTGDFTIGFAPGVDASTAGIQASLRRRRVN